jgi:hypothetical protein
MTTNDRTIARAIHGDTKPELRDVTADYDEMRAAYNSAKLGEEACEKLLDTMAAVVKEDHPPAEMLLRLKACLTHHDREVRPLLRRDMAATAAPEVPA